MADPCGVKTRSFDGEQRASQGDVKTWSFEEGQANAKFVSVGGGRGALGNFDGDYPLVLARQMEKGTRQLTDRETDRISGNSITLQIIGKNVQSLETELREEELE